MDGSAFRLTISLPSRPTRLVDWVIHFALRTSPTHQLFRRILNCFFDKGLVPKSASCSFLSTFRPPLVTGSIRIMNESFVETSTEIRNNKKVFLFLLGHIAMPFSCVPRRFCPIRITARSCRVRHEPRYLLDDKRQVRPCGSTKEIQDSHDRAIVPFLFAPHGSYVSLKDLFGRSGGRLGILFDFQRL